MSEIYQPKGCRDVDAMVAVFTDVLTQPVHSIRDCLDAAVWALEAGLNGKAIDMLSEARRMAREGNTQRCKAIAAHCTAAIQALLPVALDAAISERDVSFPMLLTPIEDTPCSH